MGEWANLQIETLAKRKTPTLAGGPSRTGEKGRKKKICCLSDEGASFKFSSGPQRRSGPAGKVLTFGSLGQAKEQHIRDHTTHLLTKAPSKTQPRPSCPLVRRLSRLPILGVKPKYNPTGIHPPASQRPTVGIIPCDLNIQRLCSIGGIGSAGLDKLKADREAHAYTDHIPILTPWNEPCLAEGIYSRRVAERV